MRPRRDGASELPERKEEHFMPKFRNRRNVVELNADRHGYEFKAVWGRTGEIDKATNKTGSEYLVMDADPWNFS